MKKPPTKRGGKREGAGRDPGPEGRASTRSITLPANKWAALDAQRGSMSASQWIASDPRLG